MYLHVSLLIYVFSHSVDKRCGVAEAFERVENISVEKLHGIVKTQGMLDDLIGPAILRFFGLY